MLAAEYWHFSNALLALLPQLNGACNSWSAPILMNATQHIFIDIHTTRAPLPRGKLFDGPRDPAGPGFRCLGRIDPAYPIATTDGREVPPQRLRIVGSGKDSPEIGGDCRFRLWSQDSEFHRVAHVGTSALAHGIIHPQLLAP